MRFLPRKAKADSGAAVTQAAWSGPPRLADRSCCCPARPVVTVLIPPAVERPHPVDLLLCGHHYLTSRAALAAADAVAIELHLLFLPFQGDALSGEQIPDGG